MSVADPMAIEGTPDFDNGRAGMANGESIEHLLARLRDVRRRIARWLPSSHSMALWSNDYTEVFGAAVRLEESVSRFDTELGACGAIESPSSVFRLQPLLDTLEARTADFEHAIVRTSAVA